MSVEIERLNHTGDGVGRINNKIVFVKKALPKDVVEIKDIHEYKNYSIANVDKYIIKSSDRIEVKCKYYQECGGCHLMGLGYSKQLEYKKEKVRDILKKYAGVLMDFEIVPSPLVNFYRNKVSLHVKDNKLGFYQNNTNNLSQIDMCCLVNENINKIIPIIQNNIDLSKIEKVIIKYYQNDLMTIFIGSADADEIKEVLKDMVASIYINEKLIYGKSALTEKLGRYLYEVSPLSFFQVNHLQTINLYNKVREYLGDNHNCILDLYCGSASIGIYVSDCSKKIIGIEKNPSSIRDAKRNIEINKLTNIEVIEGDVGSVLQVGKEIDAIIVDPPRSGLDKRTKSTLLEIGSPKIVYVSCDPITLARDLNDLSVLYDVKELTSFDMFPETYHVECVSLLQKKNL